MKLPAVVTNVASKAAGADRDISLQSRGDDAHMFARASEQQRQKKAAAAATAEDAKGARQRRVGGSGGLRRHMRVPGLWAGGACVLKLTRMVGQSLELMAKAAAGVGGGDAAAAAAANLLFLRDERPNNSSNLQNHQSVHKVVLDPS